LSSSFERRAFERDRYPDGIGGSFELHHVSRVLWWVRFAKDHGTRGEREQDIDRGRLGLG
jgi:hypothetical protein